MNIFGIRILTFNSLAVHTNLQTSFCFKNAKTTFFNYKATNLTEFQVISLFSYLLYLNYKLCCNYEPQLYQISNKHTHKHQIKLNKFATTQLFVFIFQKLCKAKLFNHKWLNICTVRKSHEYNRARICITLHNVHMYETQLII